MKKIDISIIYRDLDIIVINKPTGVSTTSDRSGADDILKVLADNFPEIPELRLVHRLDKDTSGLMVVALNRAAQTYYSRLFASHELNKTYIAISRGRPPKEQGFISDPIAKNDRIQMVKIDSQHGKKAKSFYKLLLPLGPMCLLAVVPVTGRTHQIRIHLSHRGLPLAIDPIYADDESIYLSAFKTKYRPSRKRQIEIPLIDRLTLHAYQITLPLGPDKTPQTLTAPLDKKFAATIKMLAKHTSSNPNGYVYPDVVKTILNAEPLDLDMPPIHKDEEED
jgi:23S rRNA pseudouridine1911/1915/1917 synthase